jgi:beta-lactam-binding protein with PASTA domain
MRPNRWIGLLALTSLIALAVMVSACAPSVPNVVGMPADQAVQKLQQAGYKLGSTRPIFTSGAPVNTVFAQDPVASTQLRRGQTVNLTVVQPLGSLTVPNLVGQTQPAAESALSTLSLTPAPVQDYSPSVAAGLVVSQVPPAGALVNPGDEVAFVISKGPAPAKVAVPKVTGMKQADAEAAIKKAGLVPQAVTAFSDTVASGVVASQDPASGASVSPGSKVGITVSQGKGTSPIKVPNVVGRSQADAESAIRSAGLVPAIYTQVSATVPKGVVAAQSPPAGSTTAKGGVVGVFVSIGADTSISVPNIKGMTAEEASKSISAAGLVPGPVEQPSADVPKGSVIDQLPAAGSKVAAGSQVLYAVSSGVPTE